MSWVIRVASTSMTGSIVGKHRHIERLLVYRHVLVSGRSMKFAALLRTVRGEVHPCTRHMSQLTRIT